MFKHVFCLNYKCRGWKVHRFANKRCNEHRKIYIFPLMQKPTDLLFKTIQSVVPVTEKELEEFAAPFQMIRLKTGDYFAKENEPCLRIGFILNGMIRHFYINDETETTRWVSLQSEFIAVLGSFIMQKPSNHYLQAIAPTELLVISKSDFDRIYQTNKMVQQLWLRMMEMLCLGFEDRIYQQLSMDAEKRYLYMMKVWPHIIKNVPQKYIASMMGIKPESLSRLRAKLAEQGIS
jgi:CRP-like cAMP-binding protein